MGASGATALAALKIAGRVAFERLVRPKARWRDDVPCSTGAITPEWLTAVLCEKYPGAIVTQVDVEPASAGTHERHRLTLTYNEVGRGAGLPTSIFTKSLPSVVTRMIGGFNGTARAEGRFYTQLRPLLPIEAPVGHHAASDRRSLASILLLEDLVANQVRDLLQSPDIRLSHDGGRHDRSFGHGTCPLLWGSRAGDAVSMARQLSEVVYDRRG